MKPLLAAGLCIAILLAGSMVLVSRWTEQPPHAAAAPAVEAPPVPTAPPAAAPSMTATAGTTARAVAGTAPGMRPGGEGAALDPSAPPTADRVTRKLVRKALLAAPVQARLARCVDRDGGFGGGAAPGRVPRAQPASLVLDLETASGELRIVGVRVQRWGGVSEQTVACAWEALRGQVVARRPGEPAGRLQMPFPLSPRSEPLVAKR